MSAGELQKKITELKTFFTLSNAAFDFTATVHSAFGRKLPVMPMHQLHRLALIELEKEKPNIEYIDTLLFQMEQLAEANASKK